MERPPADEILWAASRLFAARGYAATSTADIAKEAGLQQPSIFYYFPTKEDILQGLADKALVRPLEMLDAISAAPGGPAVKLYRLVAFHVRHHLSEPYDLTAVLDDVWRLPRERYPTWYQGAERYTQGIRGIVEQGVRKRVFVRTDAFLTTMAILGMCNWTLRWYHAGGRLSPIDVGDEYARINVRALLRRAEELETVVAEAARLDRELELERAASRALA